MTSSSASGVIQEVEMGSYQLSGCGIRFLHPGRSLIHKRNYFSDFPRKAIFIDRKRPQLGESWPVWIKLKNIHDGTASPRQPIR